MISRRKFTLSALLSAVGITTAKAAAISSIRPLRMEVNSSDYPRAMGMSKPMDSQINKLWVDGVDLTNCAFAFYTVEGWADCYKTHTDAAGLKGELRWILKEHSLDAFGYRYKYSSWEVVRIYGRIECDPSMGVLAAHMGRFAYLPFPDHVRSLPIKPEFPKHLTSRNPKRGTEVWDYR